MGVDERKLIGRILAGHTEEFGYFLERYGRQVFALVSRLVTQQMDAEEVAQDAFVNAFTRLDNYDSRSSFSTWISRIAYNCAIDRLRSMKRERTDDIDERQLAEVSDSMADELMQTEDEDRIVLLQKAIDTLSPDDRMLITLYYYDDRSVRDIAYIMSVKENNVMQRLHRVRKRLCVLMKRMEIGKLRIENGK